MRNEESSNNLPLASVLLPDPGKPIAEQELAVLLAMCLFGEARGESDLARRAVAQLLLNRARTPRRAFGSKPGADFAENLRRVILQPWQFSCFNPGDANRAKLLHPLDHEEPQVWERCFRCAQQALQAGDYNAQHNADPRDELTANSDHYFDDSIQPPAWADPSKQTVKIGRLNFYRLYLSPPAAAQTDDSVGQYGASAHSAAFLEKSETAGGNPRARQAGKKLPSREVAGDSPWKGAVAAATLPGTSSSGSLLTTGLPSPHLPDTSNIRPGPSQRHKRKGRLAAFVLMLLAPFRSVRHSGQRGKLGIAAALSLTLLLAACTDLERAAYQTLAVTRAEYETVQRHVAEAAVHGLITTQQWNRFQAEGHRFIDAHNTAADAFALWSTMKTDGDAARLEAMLQILPRLIREINRLVESFQEKPGSGVNSQEPMAGSALVLPPAKTPVPSLVKQSFVKQRLIKQRLVKQRWL